MANSINIDMDEAIKEVIEANKKRFPLKRTKGNIQIFILVDTTRVAKIIKIANFCLSLLQKNGKCSKCGQNY